MQPSNTGAGEAAVLEIYGTSATSDSCLQLQHETVSSSNGVPCKKSYCGNEVEEKRIDSYNGIEVGKERSEFFKGIRAEGKLVDSYDGITVPGNLRSSSYEINVDRNRLNFDTGFRGGEKEPLAIANDVSIASRQNVLSTRSGRCLRRQRSRSSARNKKTKFVGITAACVLVLLVVMPCVTFYILLKESWTELTSLKEALWQCQAEAPLLRRHDFRSPSKEPLGRAKLWSPPQGEARQHGQEYSSFFQQEEREAQPSHKDQRHYVYKLYNELQDHFTDHPEGFNPSQKHYYQEKLYNQLQEHFNAHPERYTLSQQRYYQEQLRSQLEMTEPSSSELSMTLLSHLTRDAASLDAPSLDEVARENYVVSAQWDELLSRAPSGILKDTSSADAKLEALIRDTNEYVKSSPIAFVNKALSPLKRSAESSQDDSFQTKSSKHDSFKQMSESEILESLSPEQNPLEQMSPVDNQDQESNDDALVNQKSSSIQSSQTLEMNIETYSTSAEKKSHGKLGQTDERNRRKRDKSSAPVERAKHLRFAPSRRQEQAVFEPLVLSKLLAHGSKFSALSLALNSGQHKIQKRDTSAQFLTGRGVQSTATTVRVPPAHVPSASSASSESLSNETSSSKQGSSNKLYRSLLNKRLNDPNFNASATWTPSSLDEEYVWLLERQVRDLRARIKSCRSCLSRRQRRTSSCGGGAGWRAHRRQEKATRRRLKQLRKLEGVGAPPHEGGGTPEVRGGAGTPPSALRSGCGGHNRLQVADATEATTSQGSPSGGGSGYSASGRASAASPNITPRQARENRRVSADFRRGFNQKIVRMDEALQQFSETQSAFCKELRDNLGARLGKRGQELGALSEQVAALVRSSTKQVALLEMLTSDQVYTGQQTIEKDLADLLTLKDAQVRFIKSYHKTILLPSMVSLNALLSDHASSVTSLGLDIITKVEFLQDTYVTHATRQADALQKLGEEVGAVLPQHSNLLVRGHDLARRLHANAETFVREIQTRMNNVVKELVSIRVQSQSFVNFSDFTYANISDSLNATGEVVRQLSSRLQDRLNASRTREAAFKDEFTHEAELVSARMQSGVSGALTTNHQALNQVEEAELEGRRFVNTAAAAWSEYYLRHEHERRLDADRLASNLQSYTHHTQNILTGLNTAAQTHEQVLEEQRADFSRFVRKRQEALDSQCHAISDWSALMSSELRRRDEDLHRFLSDNLHFSVSPMASYPGHVDDFIVSGLPDNSLSYRSSGQYPLPTGPHEGPQVVPSPPSEAGALNNSGFEEDSERDENSSNSSPKLEQNSAPRRSNFSNERLENLPVSAEQTDSRDMGLETLASSELPVNGGYVTEVTANSESDISDSDINDSGDNGFSGSDVKSDTGVSNSVVGDREKETGADIGPREEETTESTFNNLDFDEESVNGRGSGFTYLTPVEEDLSMESKKESQSKEVNENLTDNLGLNSPQETPDERVSTDDNLGLDKASVSSNLTSYVIQGFQPNKTSSNKTDNDVTDEDDEGFIKLQTILQAAERSILDFQNDIQVSNVYAGLRKVSNGDGRTSWLRPNGKFETGFWDDWIEHPENKSTFIRVPYKGKLRKTLWTPSSQDKKSRIFSSSRRSEGDREASDRNSEPRKASQKKRKHSQPVKEINADGI